MKKFTSRLVTTCLRVGIIFAVGIALIFSSELQLSGNKMQAIATPLTPEAKSYEIALPDRQPTSDIEKDARGVVDNITEKLNLDQPIAPSTKRFIESVKNNVGEAVTPGREAAEKATDRGSSDRAN
ncbi:hypothetical protein [Microcoleus asticus]|uniref:Low temperature-induced protein n=1 Tax=Microcoleus asticus IPMA8 TaxID=2563858 RepID=A0ABX2D870_9CYAN|nr:hypothetical protein [Microcoleus asticus]NQE38162.1 hypothetical protein [Microcoleus asticus IPMA8]